MSNKKQAIKMYNEENLSAKEISEKTGLAIRTIHQYLQKIPRNPKVKLFKTGPKPKISLEILKDLYLNQNLGIKKISEKTGLAVSTVDYHLRKNKVSKNPKAINYKTGPEPIFNLNEIINLYINKGLNTTEVGNILGCDEKTVYDRLCRAGYSIRKRGTTVNMLLKTDYFSFKNITPKSMYWVGFIVGDGNLSKNRLAISQRFKFKGVLEEFKKNINSNSPLFYFENKSPSFQKTGTICKQSIFRVVSDQIVKNLKQYGINPNKSYVGGKLNITKYKNCFLLGLLDSDGWVGFSKNRYSIGWCGHEDHMLEVQKILKEELNIELNLHKRVNIKAITTSKKLYIKKIAKYLIKDLNSLLDYKQKRLIKIQED